MSKQSSLITCLEKFDTFGSSFSPQITCSSSVAPFVFESPSRMDFRSPKLDFEGRKTKKFKWYEDVLGFVLCKTLRLSTFEV